MTRLRAAGAALLAVTVVRLAVAAAAPLSPDEAYYWVWSRALAPGYLDHPPMVALWIRAGTWVAGQTVLGIRLLGPLSVAAGSALIWRAGKDLFGAAAGMQAAVLLNATLLFGAGAVTMTPDTPLLFFWVAALAALGRLVATGNAAWWVPVGSACGLALSSKYTAVFLPMGILAWIGLTRQWRWLREPAFWSGGVLGLALVAPVVSWNAHHGWASFAKQGGRNLDFAPALAVRHLGELVAGQAALVTPLLFILCVAAVAAVTRRAWRERETVSVLLACLTVPAALVFLEHALGDRVQANWPAILYPTAALAAGGAVPGWRRALLRPGAVLGVAMTALVYVQSTLGWLELPARLDPTMRVAGYAALAARLPAAGRQGFLAADDYGIASILDFTAPSCLHIVAVEPRWALFRLPSAASVLAGRTGLLIRSDRRHAPPPGIWQDQSEGAALDRGRDGETAEHYRLWTVTSGAKPPEGVVLPCR